MCTIPILNNKNNYADMMNGNFEHPFDVNDKNNVKIRHSYDFLKT